MKPKVLVAVVLVAGALGYLAFIFLMPGDSGKDDGNIRMSFQSLTKAIVSKNKTSIEGYIAQDFSDKKVSKGDLVNIMALERVAYTAQINSIVTQGNKASVFYSRTEIRGKDGDPVTSKINGEIWARDKKNPSVWKLKKLAGNDKLFRVKDASFKKKEAEEKKPKRVLGSLETGDKRSGMQQGERYSSVGKRDPFRSLVAIDMEVEPGSKDICDPDRPRDLLESYDLLSLKLSGIILGGGAGSVALVEGPDGKGYTVNLGMYVGKHCGKIMEIERDYMIVQEQKPKVGVDIGAFEYVDTALKLRKEEG